MTNKLKTQVYSVEIKPVKITIESEPQRRGAVIELTTHEHKGQKDGKKTKM